MVFRCPDNSEYRAADYECKYKCRRPGNYRHSDNPNRHFICYRESRRLTSRIESCPLGFTFSEKDKICIH